MLLDARLQTARQAGRADRSTNWADTPQSARNSIHAALRQADFIGFREPLDSVQECLDAGVDREKMRVTGDDSFGVAVDRDAACQLLSRLRLSPGEFLAVNFRRATYAGTGTENLERFAQLVTQVATMLNMRVLVVPIARNRCDSDVEAGRELLKLLPPGCGQLLDAGDLNVKDVKGVLSQTALCAGRVLSFHNVRSQLWRTWGKPLNQRLLRAKDGGLRRLLGHRRAGR